MAIHRVRLFARSAGTERVAANANAARDPLASFPYSQCQTAQSSSFPRRVFYPRVPCFRFASPSPNRGAGGAPGGGILISIALVRRDPTFARRSRPGQTGTGLSALHPGDFGPAPRSASPALPPARSRGQPRCPGVAPGAAEVPNLPGRGYGRTPGRHTSLRLRDRLRRRPS